MFSLDASEIAVASWDVRRVGKARCETRQTESVITWASTRLFSLHDKCNNYYCPHRCLTVSAKRTKRDRPLENTLVGFTIGLQGRYINSITHSFIHSFLHSFVRALIN